MSKKDFKKTYGPESPKFAVLTSICTPCSSSSSYVDTKMGLNFDEMESYIYSVLKVFPHATFKVIYDYPDW